MTIDLNVTVGAPDPATATVPAAAADPQAFAEDIPLELARRAHAGTSFFPERRADQVRAEYAGQLANDFNALFALADTPAKLATFSEEWPRYRDGMRRHTLAHLQASTRVMSTMIAGPANFPAARQRKIGDSADRRRDELLAFRKRALEAIARKLQPELRPIMAGDDDALERLRAAIVEAEEKQAAMVADNAAIRRAARGGAEAQLAALVARGHSPGVARVLLEPDYLGRVGHADFEIKNNGANVRRLRERLVALERAKATPASVAEGAGGVRLEDDPPANRVRLYYPGKPDRATLDDLAAHGFRWTPSLRCHQAYRNDNSIRYARRAAGLEQGQ